MNPRKKDSKKWSPLPPELSKQIKDVFEENFKQFLSNKSLHIEGRIYPTELLMRVGINTKNELRYQNFEVSLDHSGQQQNTLQQIHLAVDALASLMLEYFDNNEEHDIPLTWHEFPFEKQKIWLQFSSENKALEHEANKLLGESYDDQLLNEENSVELSDEELEIYGLRDDEEIDTSKPKIFRVPTDNALDSKKKKKKDDLH